MQCALRSREPALLNICEYTCGCARSQVPAEELCAILQEPFGAGSPQWVRPMSLHLLICFLLAVLQVMQTLATPCLLHSMWLTNLLSELLSE